MIRDFYYKGNSCTILETCIKQSVIDTDPQNKNDGEDMNNVVLNKILDKLDKMDARLENVENSIIVLQQDMKVVKQDIKVLKKDVAELKVKVDKNTTTINKLVEAVVEIQCQAKNHNWDITVELDSISK